MRRRPSQMQINNALRLARKMGLLWRKRILRRGECPRKGVILKQRRKRDRSETGRAIFQEVTACEKLQAFKIRVHGVNASSKFRRDSTGRFQSPSMPPDRPTQFLS